MFRTFFCALAFSVGIANAGSPIPTTVTCPVDGQEFEIVTTASCSHFGFRMSLAAITSCDFITQLPICPGSGFPVYREFTEDEQPAIRAIVASDAYKAASDGSAFYLAWLVAGELGDTDPKGRFEVLLRGLWHDQTRVMQDRDFLELLKAEAGPGIAAFDEGDQPFLRALMAYVELLTGDRDTALAMLASVKKAAPPEAGILPRYIEAIEACAADPDSDTCIPFTPIPEE